MWSTTCSAKSRKNGFRYSRLLRGTLERNRQPDRHVRLHLLRSGRRHHGWDDHGYARDRIARFLDDNRPSNPVVITGDLHCSWVADLKAYYPDENSATVGTEFIGTSITSGLGEEYEEAYRDHLEDNPHVRFFDERTGGYVRCEVTPEEWRTEMRLADSIEEPDSPVRTFASFVIEDGRPGAERA